MEMSKYGNDLIINVIEGYHDLIVNKSDPRVKDWFLMSSPFPTLVISLSYAYFSKVLGQKLMEKRKPMNLQNVLIIYNFIQVLISIWMFQEGLAAGWLFHYSFRCQPVDYSNNPLAIRMAEGCWWYFMSTFTELLDTIFCVLCKKNNQISTLHVIHHGVMPVAVWIGVKFAPGGHGTFFGVINTFVRIFMYSYYWLAAFGPLFQKYLWWKKYLTILQMVQFVLVMIHTFQLLFIECNYPRILMWLLGLHATMFYFLFSDFYKQAYRKKEDNKGHGDETRRDKELKLYGNICFPQIGTRSNDTELRHDGFVNKKTE